jgi:ligand-binding sensor domain-containing protein
MPCAWFVYTLRVAVIGAALIVSLFVSVTAQALDSNRMLTQYGHSARRIQDGVVPGAVTSLAQTKDGTLWVGARDGLLRFNGVELVPFKPPSGEPIQSPKIFSMLGARD